MIQISFQKYVKKCLFHIPMIFIKVWAENWNSYESFRSWTIFTNKPILKSIYEALKLCCRNILRSMSRYVFFRRKQNRLSLTYRAAVLLPKICEKMPFSHTNDFYKSLSRKLKFLWIISKLDNFHKQTHFEKHLWSTKTLL